jgi:hypothetical protein
MKISLNRLSILALVALSIAAGSALPAVGHAASRLAVSATASVGPSVMYVSGGHLWTRSVDGGPPTLVRTPWAMATKPYSAGGVQWSPDSLRIALDDGNSRLAVINLANGHVTMLLSGRCRRNCSPPTYTWSTTGRYLAILEPAKNQSIANLSVWDSSTGKRRALMGGVSTFSSGLYWSHDDTRLAVNTGTFDTIKSIFPSVTIVDLNGRARTLGKGTYSVWSPDDRFIASIRSIECGANTCDDAEIVRPVAGGQTITLASHMDSNFENPEWARASGYAFDRWELGPSGNLSRRVAGPHERVDSWQPGGSHLAVQTYYPYESTPDALYIETPQGGRVHLYTDGPNAGCGACSKDIYNVAWSHDGKSVAFATPTYPTPKLKTVHPKFFVAGIDGTGLTQIPIPGADYIDILAFVDNDQAVVIYSGKKIYRFDIPTRRLATIATGVVAEPGLPAIDPAATS